MCVIGVHADGGMRDRIILPAKQMYRCRSLPPAQIPLVETLGVSGSPAGEVVALLKGVDPVTFLTVGSRVSPPGRPPGMSVDNVFFDRPEHDQSQSFITLKRQAPAELTRRLTPPVRLLACWLP